jgi:hypothetical protein
MPVSSERELAKGAMKGPATEQTGSVPQDVPADAKDEGFRSGKSAAAASEQNPEPECTEASGNSGWHERGPDLNDTLQPGRHAHVTTEVAKFIEHPSTDSQAPTNATPLAGHPTELNSASRNERTIEPSLVRGSEKTVHGKVAVESAGARGLSVTATHDAGSPIPVRDPAEIAEVRGSQEGRVDPSRTAGKEISGVSGEETFARMDADGSPRSIHWVQAGTHHAEAGYLDPALGWVGVRAESSGGGFHAAVLPGSSEAAQVLSSHLGGLNALLAQEHGPHATATMAEPQDARYGAGAEQGNSPGGGSGRDESAGKDGARTGQESVSPLRTSANAVRAVGRSTDSDGSVMRRSGTHVSVMA